jgi:hypothetical protein
VAHSLIHKTTITNIINVLFKILIIIPLFAFGPIATICFRFSPNLPQILGACTSLVDANLVIMFTQPTRKDTNSQKAK